MPATRFCGRRGGFDGTVRAFRVTARAPRRPPAPERPRHPLLHSQQRVFVARSPPARSEDILAHELGHQIDLTKGGDRTANIDVDEAEEALADMYAYDFDHDDATLGEADPSGGFPTGSLASTGRTPGVISRPRRAYPAHHSEFKCARTDTHFNGTIDSHAYFLFDQKIGQVEAAAVLHELSSALGPAPNALHFRDLMIQRAGELFGTSSSVRKAAIAAWSEVGLAPGKEVLSQHPSCVG